ncbi:MAG TPA: inorganic pyrophosphatase [Phycisphaerae bacterium]|nr:inorganic pyrophosphatase [Phycisphaerae bacterium]
MSEAFWRGLDELIATSRLVIDRPAGATHERFPEFVYPYDYGFLEGTVAADGGGVDVWVGSLPDRRLTGVICTVDLHRRDTELKLLLGCTPEEAQEILAAHNGGRQAGVLLPRPR